MEIKALLQVVEELINTRSPLDAQRLLENHPELVSADSMEVLRSVVLKARGQGEVERAFLLERLAKSLYQLRLAIPAESGIELMRLAKSLAEFQSTLVSAVIQDHPIILLTRNVLSNHISLDEAVVRAGAPETTTYLNNELVSGLDIPIREMLERGSKERAFLLARLNFEAAQVVASPRVQASSGSTLLRAMPTSEEFVDLRVHACEIAIGNVGPQEDLTFWAQLTCTLGEALMELMTGDRAENLERAIECYQNVLCACDPETNREEWGTAIGNLGKAYCHRVQGEKSQNTELAIQAFETAISIFTCENSPLKWALTMFNLGTTYRQRVVGDRLENIRRSIHCYESALTVFTQESSPEQWAATLESLGDLHTDPALRRKEQNPERAIECYLGCLQVFVRDAFLQKWLDIMNRLADAYRNRKRGNAADNLEQAIRCYEATLDVYTQKAFPVEWALTKTSLALVYRDRIKGSKTDNIEKSIEYSRAALQVYTRESFPLEWAVSMNMLGEGFRNRIEGERNANTEEAIACYEAALQVCTPHSSPLHWAVTMNNLGLAYSSRIQGERAENAERAIEYSRVSLQYLTSDSFPGEWSDTVHNLGNHYSERIYGEQAENLDQAIEYYEAARQVTWHEDLLEKWASTTDNLGFTYLIRLHGERAENIERAIECYQELLQIHTLEAFPVEWADNMNNLAAAYSVRLRGNKAENEEKAIECYSASLQIRTRERLPEGWARTMGSLGSAYKDRTRGKSSENLERAIDYYKSALDILTPESHGGWWIIVIHNLGSLYWKRTGGVKSENEQRAVEYLKQAAQTSLNLNLPDSAMISFRSLGRWYFDLELYDESAEAYSQALKQTDLIRTKSLSLKRRADILRSSANLFELYIISLMKSGQHVRALEASEMARSRSLIDLLTLRDSRPKNVPRELAQKYERSLLKSRTLEELLQRSYLTEMNLPDPHRGPGTADEEEQIRALRHEVLESQDSLRKLINEIHLHDPGFWPEADPINAEEIKALAREANVIFVVLHVTHVGSFTFLVFPDGEIDVIEERGLNTLSLNALHVSYKGDEMTGGWIFRYYSYQEAMLFKSDDEAERARRAWLDTMDETLHKLYEGLFKHVHKRLKEKAQTADRKLERMVIVPSHKLAVFPLHACWGDEDGERCYLADEFVISYAPSLSVFKQCLARESVKREELRFLAIANPQPPGDLFYSEWECVEVSHLFGASQTLILRREGATKSEVLRTAGKHHLLHFSCHGVYRLDAPLQSSLSLAKGEILTLNEILEELDLHQCWLTVLSACETGLVDFVQVADEQFGLPMGFLFAGSPTVWATLWPVNDVTTALLNIKGYEFLLKDGKSKAVSIRGAQLWLRDAKVDRLREFLSQKLSELEDREEVWTDLDRIAWTAISSLSRELKNSNSEDTPFAHPYYWAGVQCVGV